MHRYWIEIKCNSHSTKLDTSVWFLFMQNAIHVWMSNWICVFMHNEAMRLHSTWMSAKCTISFVEIEGKILKITNDWWVHLWIYHLPMNECLKILWFDLNSLFSQYFCKQKLKKFGCRMIMTNMLCDCQCQVFGCVPLSLHRLCFISIEFIWRNLLHLHQLNQLNETSLLFYFRNIHFQLTNICSSLKWIRHSVSAALEINEAMFIRSMHFSKLSIIESIC